MDVVAVLLLKNVPFYTFNTFMFDIKISRLFSSWIHMLAPFYYLNHNSKSKLITSFKEDDLQANAENEGKTIPPTKKVKSCKSDINFSSN